MSLFSLPFLPPLFSPQRGPASSLGVIPVNPQSPNAPPTVSAPVQQPGLMSLNPQLYSGATLASQAQMAQPAMSAYSQRSLLYEAGQAASSGAVFVGADYLLNKHAPSLMRFAWSAGSDFASQLVEPSVAATFLKDPVSQYNAYWWLCPLLSGGIYVGADALMKFDNRSKMYLFLLQAGSSFGGALVYAPIAKTLGVM